MLMPVTLRGRLVCLEPMTIDHVNDLLLRPQKIGQLTPILMFQMDKKILNVTLKLL